MEQVNEFLSKPLFQVSGLQVTVGLVILVIAVWMVAKRLK